MNNLIEKLEFKVQSEYFSYKHEFHRLTEQEKISYFFTKLNLWKTIYHKYPLSNKSKNECDRFNKELVNSIEYIKEKILKYGIESIIEGDTYSKLAL